MKHLFFLLSFCILACGRYEAQRPSQPPGNLQTVQNSGGLSLLVFGAGFCGVCKVDFPKLNHLLSDLPQERKNRLNVILYYVAGDPQFVRPTIDLATKYARDFFSMASAQVDPWMWQNFRKYFADVQLSVPAAVVLDRDENVLKRYPPGNTTFVVEEIFDFLKQKLDEFAL